MRIEDWVEKKIDKICCFSRKYHKRIILGIQV